MSEDSSARRCTRRGAQFSPSTEALLNLDSSLTDLFGFSPQPVQWDTLPPVPPLPEERPQPPAVSQDRPAPPTAPDGATDGRVTTSAAPPSPVLCRRLGSATKRRRPPTPLTCRSSPHGLSLSLSRRRPPAVERLRRRLAGPSTPRGESPPDTGPRQSPPGADPLQPPPDPVRSPPDALRSPPASLRSPPDALRSPPDWLRSPPDSLCGSVQCETPPLPSQYSEAAPSAASSCAGGESQRQRRALVRAALQDTNISSSAVGPFHGLPSLVSVLLEKQRGITSLYAWQEECLKLPAVRERKNLVYSLPTSGGKTLVAELLIMKEVLCRKRDCMLVLPYVALVQEKVRTLAPFGIALGFLLEEYAGGRGTFPPTRRLKRRVVYVCTIEKANGLLTSLIELDRAGELGLAVIDEVHMLGEGGGRGATLEGLVTKLKFAAPSAQLIGMSATIGNMADIAGFLEASVYTRPFRPVQLREHVLFDGQLLEVTGTAGDDWEHMLSPRRRLTLQYTEEQRRQDPDGVGALVAEVVPANSCLVFCATRKNCEAVALMICASMSSAVREHLLDRKKAVYNVLMKDGDGIVCPVLRRTLPFGVAYHHSGLTTDERKLLEEAYLEGTLCCLCCTSTLAAGVNLPAKRVVLRSPYTGMAFLSRGRYKQMVGRAGRAGIDDSGESILIVSPKDTKRVRELLMAPMERCHSTMLEDSGHGLRRLLLSAVALGLCDSPAQLHQLLSRTLLSVQADSLKVDCAALLSETVATLRSERLLRVSRRDGEPAAPPDGTWSPEFQLKVSRLGTAAVKGNVDLRVAHRLYDDLKTAQVALAVINQLHMLFLVTPYDMMDTIRPVPDVYMDMYMSLEPEEAAVARLIGVSEVHVIKLMSGARSKGTDPLIAQRFYLTLLLYDCIRSGSLWRTSERCQLHRGQLQTLLQAAITFSSAVLHFCKQLEEFWPFVQLLDVFNRKLVTGCSTELTQLMELPAVKQGRARALFAAGYKTLSDVANAEPEVLVRTLDLLPHRVARQMVDSAKMLVLEKAEALQEEAEVMLDGLKSAKFHATPGLEEVLLNSPLARGETMAPPGDSVAPPGDSVAPPGDSVAPPGDVTVPGDSVAPPGNKLMDPEGLMEGDC